MDLQITSELYSQERAALALRGRLNAVTAPDLKAQIKQEWSFIRAWTTAAVRLFSKCTRCQNCKYNSELKRFTCALMNPLSLAQHTDPRALRTMTCERFVKRTAKKSVDVHLVKS